MNFYVYCKSRLNNRPTILLVAARYVFNLIKFVYSTTRIGNIWYTEPGPVQA